MKYALRVGPILLVACLAAGAEDNIVKPSGVYAQIDTRRDVRAVEALESGSAKEKAAAAQDVLGDAGRYCPAVFFPLAAYLFAQGQPDEALFWMYSGRIRAWYDVKRSADPSVADTVVLLNQGLPDLLRLTQFEDLDRARSTLDRAIAWDRDTPHDYDARWIALHGMGAFLPEPASGPRALTVPEDQWADLAETNRAEYLADYLADLAAVTPEQMTKIKAKILELKAATAAKPAKGKSKKQRGSEP